MVGAAVGSRGSASDSRAMQFSSRRTWSAAFSSRSAETANREKSAFRARNFHCRERTSRPCVVNCQRDSMRDGRDRAAETAPGDPEVARSPLRAHPASALWCTTGVCPCTPFFLPHLRVARGPYRADRYMVIHSRLHAAERPLAAFEHFIVPSLPIQFFQVVLKSRL